MSLKHFGRGDRNAQQRRRRKNNRTVLVQDEDYRLIDNNYSPQPFAYCCYYASYMTRNQTILHKCNERACPNCKTFEWAKKRGKT